jgi:integrase
MTRPQLAPGALWYATLSRDGTRFTGKTKAGKDISSAVAADLKLFCDRADIPYPSPHSLRHDHALFALDRATSIAAAKAISQNLMHDSLTTTEKIYGKLNRDNVRRHIASLTGVEQPSSNAA